MAADTLPRSEWPPARAATAPDRPAIAVGENRHVLDSSRGWDDFLDAVEAAGATAIRVPVGPVREMLDREALGRRRTMLVRARDRGIEPHLVLLRPGPGPRWDAGGWLATDAPARFTAWAGVAAEHFGEVVDHWTTVESITEVALGGAFPGSGTRAALREAGGVGRAVDGLAAAHIGAYGAIKDRHPGAVVSLSTSVSSLYEVDACIRDVALSGLDEVPRRELGAWLRERREQHYARIDGDRRVTTTARSLRRWSARALPLERFLPRTIAAMRHSPHPCTLDEDQVVVVEPRTEHRVRRPGRRTIAGREWSPVAADWECTPDPAAFETVVTATAAAGFGRPVRVAGHGLAGLAGLEAGGSMARPDGWDHARFIRAHLRPLVRMLDAGLPLAGYTLTLPSEGTARHEAFDALGHLTTVLDRSGSAP